MSAQNTLTRKEIKELVFQVVESSNPHKSGFLYDESEMSGAMIKLISVGLLDAQGSVIEDAEIGSDAAYVGELFYQLS